MCFFVAAGFGRLLRSNTKKWAEYSEGYEEAQNEMRKETTSSSAAAKPSQRLLRALWDIGVFLGGVTKKEIGYRDHSHPSHSIISALSSVCSSSVHCCNSSSTTLQLTSVSVFVNPFLLLLSLKNVDAVGSSSSCVVSVLS
ncbi:unnamed protein product [Caenorhabditis nigoni]